MEQRAVAYRASVADRNGKSRIGVHNDVFLEICVITDDDWFVVTSQHGTEPDAHIHPE
jgi:hypothetical protein